MMNTNSANLNIGLVAFGVTWFEAKRSTAFVMAGALVVVLMLSAGMSPAAAAKPGSGDTADSGSTTDTCDGLSGSLTLDGVNNAIGASAHHNLKGKNAITGSGVDIAVIDTGVAPISTLNAIDGPDLSFDALNDNLRSGDLHGHGTNMAGIVAGVAPQSRIVDVKVGAADGAVDVSQVIAGIDWVVANKNTNGLNIRVINLAYDTDAETDYVTDPLTRAVEHAWHNGIVVVVAGGNDGRGVHTLGNPAIDPFVIAVGASAPKSDYWDVPTFSSIGDGTRNPDLVAPGESILSLGVAGSYLADTYSAATCVSNNELMLRGSGTSQAAAVVSGAAALLLDQRPDLTPNQVKELLTSTATTLMVSASNPVKEELQGHGMLNVDAALNAPTPSLSQSAQLFFPAIGGGLLEDARGTAHVGSTDDLLTGEMTAFGGDFNSTHHSLQELTGTAWTNQTWDGATWSGGTWSGATWSGATWSGATWSGATWSGATWSGATWSGATWSGATWSGATWSGASWS
jgi:serine protease AprX